MQTDGKIVRQYFTACHLLCASKMSLITLILSSAHRLQMTATETTDWNWKSQRLRTPGFPNTVLTDDSV